MRLLLALKRGSFMSALPIIILLSFLFPTTPSHILPAHPSLISFHFPSLIRQPFHYFFQLCGTAIFFNLLPLLCPVLQFWGTAMIYCGYASNPIGTISSTTAVQQKMCIKPCLLMLEAALFPRKLASHFFFLTFNLTIPFLLDPDPNRFWFH